MLLRESPINYNAIRSPVVQPLFGTFDDVVATDSLAELVAMPSVRLGSVDPVYLNLTVAKGVDCLADLDIRPYAEKVSRWTNDFLQRCWPEWEQGFHSDPEAFHNDIDFFRFGMVLQYLDIEVGIRYIENQRDIKQIYYLAASDLFINGVLDTGYGTCGSMAALVQAMTWRLGMPVSLACCNAHLIARFDDGQKTINMEASSLGRGGFSSSPDSYYIEQYKLPDIAIQCGSDLRALRPHELLGIFVYLRARHHRDVAIHGHCDESGCSEVETDLILARHLFPTNRLLFREQILSSCLKGKQLFEENEPGHPHTLANELLYHL